MNLIQSVLNLVIWISLVALLIAFLEHLPLWLSGPLAVMFIAAALLGVIDGKR